MLSRVLKKLFLLNFYCLLAFQDLFVKAIVPPNATTLIFYYGPQFADSTRYKLSDASQILKDPHFKKQETHLYFHGWRESQNSDSNNVPVIVDAYLKRKDINLITVDWAKAAGERYIEASLANIEGLAPVLADVVLDLYNAGIDRKDFRVVAHSLGAQLAGMMGRKIISKSNRKVKIYRMALLDAAFPLFSPGPSIILPTTVNRNDAEFVQAIHTEIGTFGQPFSLGHVDFWPNGGRMQTGCSQGLPWSAASEICSHRRSWRFWAESVANVNDTNPKFLGFPAQSYFNFLLADKANLRNEPVEMGINCPMSAKGNYYLKTNSKSPFARGKNGY